MITNIPTEANFYKSAARFLTAAWEEAINEIESAFYDEVDGYDNETSGDEADGEEADEMGADEAGTDEAGECDALVTASINAFTGIEHLLRARITAISPYLLIGDCRDWPKQCDKKDVPFGAFKTIDAQDLIKACNTVGAARLPEDFLDSFEKLRIIRNSLVHSHGSNAATAREILIAILRSTHILVGPLAWIKWRREAFQATHGGDDMPSWSSVMNKELSLAVFSLGAKDCNTYLKVNKRTRFYLCPACIQRRTRYEHKVMLVDDTQGMAQLEDPETIYCRTCEARASSPW